MADGSVIIELKTDDSKLDKGLDNAKKKAGDAGSQIEKDINKKVNQSFEETGRVMQEMGGKISEVGGILTGALTTPLVGLATNAVSAAQTFEDAFTGVVKTVDGTEAELNTLREGFISLSKEIPVSAAELAGLGEAAGQLGIEKENILGFVRTIADLGVATNLTGDNAATMLAKFANITQMPQSDFERLGSTIVELGNNLATTEADIAGMSLRLAGAGTQIGLSEAQILSFAGALSSVGIEAEAGGSAFSKVMVEMQLAVETNSKKLEQFAEISGMSAEQFKRSFKEDATGAIISFTRGLGDANQKGTSAIKILDDMGISEVRMRDALLRAASAGDTFSNAIDLGAKAWEDNIALTKEAETRYDTFSSKMQIFKNFLEEVFIRLGDPIIEILTTLISIGAPLVETLAKAARLFSDLPKPIQMLLLVLGGAVAIIGPVVSAFGGLVTTLVTLKMASIGLPAIGASFTGFSLSISPLTIKILAIVAALVALGVVIAILVGKSREFGKVGDEIGKTMDGIDRQVDAVTRKTGVGAGRGYATGTPHASPGMAWVGENGPELMMFSGGEQVFNAPHVASAAALAQRTPTGLSGSTYNDYSQYNVNVNGIGELNAMLDWFRHQRMRGRG